MMSGAETPAVSAALRAHEMRLEKPLRDAFLDGDFDGMTLEEIAVDLRISLRTLHNWMSRLGIGRRVVFVDLHAPNGSSASDEQGQEGAAA